MPTLTPQSTGADTADRVTPDPPAQARQSRQRTRRLTEYIQAHTGEDIEVVLTPHVETACVLPADADRLIDADAANFDQQAARQLVNAVDGAYLVLVSTKPATLAHLPIDDQLTADRAQQFGLSLHELGHIRYTNIGVVADHLNDRVDEDHQPFVHGLINACEDAAIEHQLREAQSQLAADRLELVNRSLTQHPSDLDPNNHVEFTYRDAIQAYLYDHGIYDSGTSDVLLASDDDRITFATSDDAQAFGHTQDALDNLLATVLSEPDSVTRGDAVIDCWEQTIKPLIDPIDDQASERSSDDSDSASGGGHPDTPQTPSPSSTSTSSESDTDERSEPSTDPDASEGTPDTASDDGLGRDETVELDSENATETPSSSNREAPDDPTEDEQEQSPADSEPSESTEKGTPSEPPADFDPANVSLEQTQDTHSADVLAYPDIGTTDDADELAPDDAQSRAATTDTAQSDTKPDSQPGTDSDSDSDSDPESEAESGAEAESESESEFEFESEADGAPSGDQEPDTVGESSPRTGDGEAGAGETVADETANSESTSTAGGATEDTDGTDSAGDATGGGAAPPDDAASEQEASADADDDDANEAETAGESNHTPNGQTSLSDFPGGDSDGDRSGDSGNHSDGGSSGDPSAGTTPHDDGSADPSDAAETSNSSPAETDDSGASDSHAHGVQGDAEGEPGDAPEDTDNTDTDASQPPRTDTPPDTLGSPDQDAPTDDSDVDHHGDPAYDGTADNGQADGDADTPEEATEPRPQPAKPAHDDSLDDNAAALDADRDAAHAEADRATPDQDQLARDLDETAAALAACADDTDDDTDNGRDGDAQPGQGGQGAGTGSLDALSILPDVGEQAPPARWQATTAGADAVGGTLRMALRESRRDQTRSGVTSGNFDRRRAGALARGDVNAFSVRQQGDDKQYDLVLVLDRSSSMRDPIDTAENAVARFALACEDLGINVAIMDFVDNDARLVKPFSVDTDHVQASLMSGETGGGTPLADALGLARSLLDQRRDSPLVIIITDGKPGAPTDYQQKLQQTVAPVCGLTLALETPRGQAPSRAQDVERFYDRHLYVHDTSDLDDRLDQFAVMFDGL